MKVLGISASPRSGGNSDVLLDKALEGAASAGARTEKLFLRDLDISPVREEEYGRVSPEGLSVVDDDMSVIFQSIAGSDALILVSPVFFGSLSAQAKTMIDRFQCVWYAKESLGMKVFEARKRGAFICVSAADRKDFFENARSIVRHFFATINFEYMGELFAPGLEQKGDALKHPDFPAAAFKMGEKLAGSS